MKDVQKNVSSVERNKREELDHIYNQSLYKKRNYASQGAKKAALISVEPSKVTSAVTTARGGA